MKGRSGHVGERATIRGAIDTREITLLGVVAAPGERRALIRLPSGRVRTVAVGDILNGGRVVTIGTTEVRYRKANRTRVLMLPP